jgi:hypothetical protein
MDVCTYLLQMHPLMRIQRPLSRTVVQRVTLLSVLIANAYYWALAACSYVVFGDDIQDDILINLR